MALNSVVISLILEQRNLVCANFLLWDRNEFLPYIKEPTRKLPLTIALRNSIPRQSFEDKISAIYHSTSQVKACFSGLEFIYPDFNSSDKTVNSEPKLSLINTLSMLTDGQYLLLNADCLPLRPDWLGAVAELVSESDAWIEGASYNGISIIDKTKLSIVHECAVYFVDPSFTDFISTIWRPLIHKGIEQGLDLLPFDILQYYADRKEVDLIGQDSVFWQKQRVTSFFSNHDGPYERKNGDGVALRKLMRDESLFIGLGKHLFRDLETIDISHPEYRKRVRLHFRSAT